MSSPIVAPQLTGGSRFLEAGAGEAILFIKRPYSALFYSLGSAEQVGDAEELQRRLDGSSRDFIVLQRRLIDALPPALSGRIEMIRSFGRYTLFAEKERSTHALP